MERSSIFRLPRSGAVRERNSILLLHGSLGTNILHLYCSAPKLLRFAPNSIPRKQQDTAPLTLPWSSKILLRSLTAPLPTPLRGSSKILHTTPPRSHSHGAAIYCSAPKLLRSKLLLLHIPALKIQIKFINLPKAVHYCPIII